MMSAAHRPSFRAYITQKTKMMSCARCPGFINFTKKTMMMSVVLVAVVLECAT